MALGMLACAAGAGWLVYLQTNSDAVRAKVIEQFRALAPGLDVQIGSAWIRPLGGLWLRDVQLFRQDDPSHPFLIVPSATIYHDKEQMARGLLVIRKIELTQPSIRLRRDADGNWNTPALSRSSQHAIGPLPMLLIHQGTIAFEDRLGGQTRPILEVGDVQLTVINDPVARLTFRGQANSLLGPLKLSGSHERKPNLLTISCDIPSYVISSSLIEQLGGHVPEIGEHLKGLEGQGDAHLDLRYQPASGGIQPDLQVNLHHGRFSHAKLPLSPLNNIELSAHYVNGELTIANGTASSGSTRASLSLIAAVPLDVPHPAEPDQLLKNFELSIDKLNLTNELFEKLPPEIQRMNEDFRPKGPVGLTFRYEKTGGHSWSRSCIIRAEGITAQYREFPYLLRDMHGKLEQESKSNGDERLEVNLVGSANGKPVKVNGGSNLMHGRFTLNLTIEGNEIAIDEDLKAALLRNRAGVEAFHPEGSADFTATIRRNPGEAIAETQINIFFKKLSVDYDEFPCPIKDISGRLRVQLGPSAKITFDHLQGSHLGGEVRVNGTHMIGPRNDVVDLRITAAGLPFDSALRKAFKKVRLQSLLETMQPEGHLNFDGKLTYSTWNNQPDVPKTQSSLKVTADRFAVDSIRPSFLPYELDNVSGAFCYDNSQATQLYVTDFQGEHRQNGVQLRIGRDFPSDFVFRPDGGIWGRLRQIVINPLVADDEFVAALPSGLRATCRALEATGPMALTIDQLEFDTNCDKSLPGRAVPGNMNYVARGSAASLRDQTPTPWIEWKAARLWFRDASFWAGLKCDNAVGIVCLSGAYRFGKLILLDGNLQIDQASVRRQPIQGLHCHIALDHAKVPGMIYFQNLNTQLYGGVVSGNAALRINPNVEYEVWLVGTRLRLEEIDRINRITSDGQERGQLSGLAQIELRLLGKGSDLKTLQGGGSFNVPNGRIYDLPPLLDLLKFARLRAPNGTFFEEAKGEFRIQADTMRFNRLDLNGDLISLTGDGTMKLDGSNLRLNVYTVWSRVVQVLPNAVREIPNSISRNLYKIEMRGSLGGPLDFRQEAVPILVEPAKRLLDRLRQMSDPSRPVSRN
jgi:hypothetical protein